MGVGVVTEVLHSSSNCAPNLSSPFKNENISNFSGHFIFKNRHQYVGFAEIQGASVNRAILRHCFFWFGNTGADAAIAIFLPTLTLRQLMSYIYGAPILDVSRSHTTTQHSR